MARGPRRLHLHHDGLDRRPHAGRDLSPQVALHGETGQGHSCRVCSIPAGRVHAGNERGIYRLRLEPREERVGILELQIRVLLQQVLQVLHAVCGGGDVDIFPDHHHVGAEHTYSGVDTETPHQKCSHPGHENEARTVSEHATDYCSGAAHLDLHDSVQSHQRSADHFKHRRTLF